MKALVIENEFIVPSEIKTFTEVNKGMFSVIDIEIACKHRPFEELAQIVFEHNAIIIRTDFYYKAQLEQFAEAFAVGFFHKKEYSFFLFNPVSFFNDCILEKDKTQFKNLNSFLSNLKILVSRNKVYGYTNNGQINLIKYNPYLNEFEYERGN